MKRTLSTILLISMLSSLSACGGTEVGSDDTTVAGGDDTIADTTPAETTEAPRPDLPELDLEDYVLRVFKQDQSKILWAPNAFAPEEENGDILNDAYYKRNRIVTEKYGFTIEETISSSNPNSTVTSNILAGDDVCDVMLTHLNLANTSYGGNYLNWHDLVYVDLEKEW